MNFYFQIISSFLFRKYIFLLFTFFAFSLQLNSQSVLDKEYLFDDLNYSRLAFPAAGDSSGSMFGKNPWITKRGIEYSRAWRRYQDIDTNTYRKGIDMSLDSNGVILGITKDHKKEYGYAPEIVSDFIFREGTFAARIKFSKFNHDKLIQSFYEFSPVMLNFGDKNKPERYWSEFDFEFNNCWYKDDKPRLQVGCNNHDGKNPLYGVMDCITNYKDEFHSFDECQGNYMGHNFFEDNWIIYVFRTNKLLNKMEIEAFPDDPNLPFDFWSGFSSEPGNWGRSFQIPNYFPKYKLRTVLFIGACSDITSNLNFATDWFFFSPNPELTGSEILKQVKNLKDAGIDRINTTPFPTYNEVSEYAPENLAISGPISASVCIPSKWTVEPQYKGRHVYNVDLKYRVYSKGNAGNWEKVYKPEIMYSPFPEDDSIEIMMIYKDDWIPEAETLFYFCTFQKTPCQNLTKSVIFRSLYPNPVNEELTVEIEVLIPSEIKIELFDKLGYKIIEIHNGFLDAGKYKYLVNTEGLFDGSYYIRAVSPTCTEVNKIIIMKY